MSQCSNNVTTVFLMLYWSVIPVLQKRYTSVTLAASEEERIAPNYGQVCYSFILITKQCYSNDINQRYAISCLKDALLMLR